MRAIVWPMSWRACLLSVLAVGVLALGEISAAKIVSTPGAETFAEVVWTQMHYGVGPDLAADRHQRIDETRVGEIDCDRHDVLDAAAGALHHRVDGAEDHPGLSLEITGHRLALLVDEAGLA